MNKRNFRKSLDMLMTVALPLLMAFELIGRATHEWLGVTMFLLVVLHQLLNGAWYKHLFHGKYHALRTAVVVLDMALVALVLAQAVSGISMARYLPDALPKLLRRSVARKYHMACAYWCFVLMCTHMGFHLNGLVKKLHPALRGVGCAAAGYGVYAFVKRQLPGYLFGQISFAFFDFEEPLLFFFADYLAIMVLFALLGWFVHRTLRKGKRE